MERKTKEEILKAVFECDDLRRNFSELSDRPFSFPAIIKAMQRYADQEKEAEALSFADYCGRSYVRMHDDKWLLDTGADGEFTTSELYQLFTQQNQK